MSWGTNDMGNQWDGGPMRWGTIGIGRWWGDEWKGGPMRWGTSDMGDQWDGVPMSSNNVLGDQWVGGPMRRGPMRWGTNEMGDQWADPRLGDAVIPLKIVFGNRKWNRILVAIAAHPKYGLYFSFCFILILQNLKELRPLKQQGHLLNLWLYGPWPAILRSLISEDLL